MTTEPKQQMYIVNVRYADTLFNRQYDDIIDWKLENDIYFFFQKVEGQARPRIITQWLKAQGLSHVMITPVGISVPLPPPIQP